MILYYNERGKVMVSLWLAWRFVIFLQVYALTSGSSKG